MGIGRKITTYIRRASALRSGTDVDGTIDGIRKNVELRGANVWLLVCAALIASIGLDVNSTAVIIGAMLISPLMSSILGVGLGVAILDTSMLRRSLASLAIATVTALTFSTLYFAISPLSQMTTELSARTTPTFLDVCVAFFGGVAGMVAGSRKEKTSAIPGVAIATALMPPLCTVGFGLAHLDASVIFGAFFLYFINAVFIALATYLMAKLLRFPAVAAIDEKVRNDVTRAIVVFVVITIVPSSFIFANVILKLRFEQHVKSFVSEKVQAPNREAIRWEIDRSKLPEELKVYVVGMPPTNAQTLSLNDAMYDYGIADLKLRIVPLNVSPAEFGELSENVKTNLVEKLQIIETLESSQGKELQRLKDELKKIKSSVDPVGAFVDEVKAIDGVETATEIPAEPDAPQPPAVHIGVSYLSDVSDEQRAAIRQSITALAAERLPGRTVQIGDMRAEPVPMVTPELGN